MGRNWHESVIRDHLGRIIPGIGEIQTECCFSGSGNYFFLKCSGETHNDINRMMHSNTLLCRKAFAPKWFGWKRTLDGHQQHLKRELVWFFLNINNETQISEEHHLHELSHKIVFININGNTAVSSRSCTCDEPFLMERRNQPSFHFAPFLVSLILNDQCRLWR